MNRYSGAPAESMAHLRQSIHDIITTRVRARVELRAYGSNLPDRVDDPQNRLFEIELFADTAGALAKWEPRFVLTRVALLSGNSSGRVQISVEGYAKDTGAEIYIEGITL